MDTQPLPAQIQNFNQKLHAFYELQTFDHSSKHLKQNWCMHESEKHLLMQFPKQIAQFGGGLDEHSLLGEPCITARPPPADVSGWGLSTDASAIVTCSEHKNSLQY